jgi:hypothetical protein
MNTTNQVNPDEFRKGFEEYFLGLDKQFGSLTGSDFLKDRESDHAILWMIRHAQLHIKYLKLYPSKGDIRRHNLVDDKWAKEMDIYRDTSLILSYYSNPKLSTEKTKYLPEATKDMNCYGYFNKAIQLAETEGYPDKDEVILKYLIKLYRDRKKALVCFIAVKQDETDATIDEMSQQPASKPEPIQQPASKPEPVQQPVSKPEPVQQPASKPEPVQQPALGGSRKSNRKSKRKTRRKRKTLRKSRR